MLLNIKKYREKCGLTQDELAKKAGVARVTICKYEKNVINPSVNVLLNISRALGVSTNALCGEETIGKTECKDSINYEAEYERLRSAHNDIVQDNMALHEENKALKRHLDILEKQLEIVKLIFGGNENV
jgi:DNA-binding XRE family transcriptional regulator